ncbi:protein wntless-like [Adelges cooleyi]|uniref:protein wntless-like n=1 Tax=Adelges cooleyi TaxID=133065 RepID=UPI00218078C0|nr:protein wntless-like [Adelges cooleyi]
MARNRNRSRPEPPVPNTAESTYSYMLQCVSNETFFFVAAMLFVTQVSIVMCGTMFPPSSQNKQPVLATTCLKTPKNSMPEVYGHSLRSCKTYNLEEYSPGSLNTTNLDEDEIVFSFEMPEPEDHDSLIRYLRWQQNIIGSMFFEVAHRPEDKEDVIIFDVGMDIEFTHANKGSQFAKFYEMIDVKHQVDCKLLYNDMYACTMIKLFELSPFNFDYNMVKIKLRGDSTKLKRLTDMWLTVKNKNDFVSRLWLLFKTMVWFLAFSIAVLAYKTWRQIERHDSKFHITITEMFTSILALLLVPLDVAVRPFNAGLADSMLVFRNNNFHIALIIYWIIFIGEHLVDSKKRSLYYFARSASCITTVCSFNLVTNWWIRGGELRSSSFASVAASELSVFVLMAKPLMSLTYPEDDQDINSLVPNSFSY